MVLRFSCMSFSMDSHGLVMRLLVMGFLLVASQVQFLVVKLILAVVDAAPCVVSLLVTNLVILSSGVMLVLVSLSPVMTRNLVLTCPESVNRIFLLFVATRMSVIMA